MDGLICGTWGTTANHLMYIDQVIGKHAGGADSTAQDAGVPCMNGLMLPGRQVFLVDTHVNYDPTPQELAEITALAAEEMMRFGIKPKAALLSHSNFGTSNPQRGKMRQTWSCCASRPLAGSGRRNAWRRGAGRQGRAGIMPSSELNWRRQPAGVPQHRRRQHCLQPAQDGSRWRHCHRPGAAGRAKPVHILTPSATVRRS